MNIPRTVERLVGIPYLGDVGISENFISFCKWCSLAVKVILIFTLSDYETIMF